MDVSEQKTSVRSRRETRSQPRTWCNSINFREIASGSTRAAEPGSSSVKRTLNKCTGLAASRCLAGVALFLLSCYKSLGLESKFGDVFLTHLKCNQVFPTLQNIIYSYSSIPEFKKYSSVLRYHLRSAFLFETARPEGAITPSAKEITLPFP